MRLIKLSVVIYLSFLTYNSYSQDLKFSADGKLVEAPPSRLKRKKAIELIKNNLEITLTPDQTAQKEDSAMRYRILYMDSLLNGPTTMDEQAIQREIATLYVFFKSFRSNTCPFDTSSLRKPYQSCLSNEDVTAINGWIQLYHITPAVNTCFSDLCKCFEKDRKLKRWAELQALLENFQQKKLLIREMLCVKKGPVNSFKLSTNTYPELIQFVTSDKSLHPDMIPVGFTYRVNKKLMRWDAKNKRYTYDYAIEKKAVVDVSQTKKMDSLLIDWYNTNQPFLETSYINQVREQWQEDIENVDSLRTFLDCREPCTLQAFDRLSELNETLKKYDSVWCQTSPIAIWLKKWLWINKGDFSLNPFKFTTKKQNKVSDKLYEELKRKETNLIELGKKIEDLKKCLRCEYTAKDTLKLLQDAAEVVRLEKEKLEGDIKNADENSAALEEFTTTTKLLHSIRLPTGKEHIIYHDVSDGYSLTNEKKPVLPDAYTVYFGMMNSKTKEDADLSWKQEKLDFNDGPKIIQELSKSLAALSTSASILAPDYLAVSGFLNNLFGSFDYPTSHAEGYDVSDSTLVPTARREQFLSLKNNGLGDSGCIKLRLEVQVRLWRWELLSNLLRKYQEKPAPSSLQAKSSEAAQFYTYAKKAEEFAAPYTNKYTIKYKDKDVLTHQYSIGRQKTISIGAGVFFNQNPARIVSVDATGNTLSIKNTDTRAKYVIGLKLFPFKAFEADGSLLPRFFEKRVSLFGGFEITRPLNNLYLGIGYDVVPGLQVSIGNHYYRADVYQIQNNQIKDQTTTYKRSGIYYGVTIIPEVVAEVVKNLFSKK